MKLGALLPPSDGADSRYLAGQAREIESAGFDSIWSAHAVGRGFMMADPLIALTVAASVTESVEIGTAILQLPLYNPTDVALKALTLQQISGDRFILGVGAGSTESDYAVHNLPFKTRFDQFETGLSALKQTFVDGSAGDGNISPWKRVAGGPPLFFGTWGRHIARAANEFDGWIASAMHRTPQECADALKGFRQAGGKRAVVSTIQVLPGGDLGELRDKLAAFADAGFDDAVVMVFPGGPSLDDVRRLLS